MIRDADNKNPDELLKKMKTKLQAATILILK